MYEHYESPRQKKKKKSKIFFFKIKRIMSERNLENTKIAIILQELLKYNHENLNLQIILME